MRIRVIESDMKRFESSLTDFGLAIALDYSPGKIEQSPMILIFGMTTTHERIDDFKFVCNQLGHIKSNSNQARNDRIGSELKTWELAVIRRYYMLAVQVTPDDESIGMNVFVEGVSIPKTFKECFPALDMWKQQNEFELDKPTNLLPYKTSRQEELSWEATLVA